MWRRSDRAARAFTLVAGWLAAFGSPAAAQEPGVRKPEVWAVLVAIDDYEGVPDVPGARRDALALRDWLQREAGWPSDHILMMDRLSRRQHLGPEAPLPDLYPTREHLSWALRSWLPARVRPGDLVVVYFAGQAVGLPPREDVLPGSPPRCYLLPIDADAENIPGTGWSIEEDLDALATSGRNPVFVWLDTSLAGRGGPVLAGLEPVPSARWLATVARWPGVSAWLAADGRPSAEGEVHSPFLAALIDGLGTTERRRNLLACLARMHRDPALASQGFRTSGSVPTEATLWEDDLAPRRVVPPELILRHGHSDDVLDLALTADGATLVSAGEDSTVKLWRADDRALLRTLAQHFIGVKRVAISPDGSRLASGDGAGSVWVYALPEFAPLQTRSVRPHDGPVEALAFLDDGQRLASLDTQGNVLLWDVSGRTTEPRKLPVVGSALAAGGGRLAVSWSDPALRNASRFTIFDRDGEPIAERPGPGGLTTLGLIALDGDRLAIADRNGGLALWRLGEGPELTRRENLPGPVRAVSWSNSMAFVAAGEALGIIPATADGPIRHLDAGWPVEHLAATADGRLIAAAPRGGPPRVWDLSGPGAPRPLVLAESRDDRGEPSTTATSRMIFAPGGDALVVGCTDGAIRAWTLPEGTPRPEIAPHGGQIVDLAVSPEARYLLQVSRDGEACLWDLDLGRTLRPIPGCWTSGVFVDAETLALTDEGGDVALIDRARGERIARTFERPRIEGRQTLSQAAFDRIAASPDGRFLAAGCSTTDLACLWDVATGRLLRPFRAHPDGVADVAFSTDSARLLTAGHEGAAKLWAVDEAPARPPLLVVGDGEEGPPVTAAAIDPAIPDRVVLGDQDGRVVRWSIGDDGTPVGEELDRLRGTVRALAFTADGNWLAAAGEDKEVRLVALDGPRPRPVRLSPRHDEEVAALVPWPDAPIVASAGADTTIRLWRVDEQALLGTLAGSPSSGNWVAYTPGGHFDSAPGAERLLARSHIDGRVSTLDQDYDRLRTFRLAASLRRGAAPQPLPTFEPSQLPSLVLDPPPGRAAGRGIPLTLTLGDAGLTDFRLYLNGVPVRDSEDFTRPDPDDPARLVVEAPLRRGQNELYVLAGRGEPGSPLGRSNTVSVVYDGPERPGRLHILALGVDDYPNRPLKFSAADARSLVDFLQANHIDAQLEGACVRVLTNDQVDRDAVREALSDIRLEARPDDTVAVFIAGHTDVRPDRAGRDQFCLLLPGFPFPETDPRVFKDQGIRVALRGNLPVGGAVAPNEVPPEAVLPYAEIERWLVRMDALQRVVILDACQAEAVMDDPVARRRRENVAAKVDDDAHQARTTYLLASRRDMPALEVERLGHGLLTYILLRGMGAPVAPDPEQPVDTPMVPLGGADLDSDDLITTTELSTFADRYLPILVARYAGSAPRSGDGAPPERGPRSPVAGGGGESATSPLRPASLQASEESAFPLVRVPK